MSPNSTVSRRARMLGCGTAFIFVLSLFGSTMTAAAAPTDPIAAKQAEAAALARTIDAQGRQIEVLAEQYNGARYHVDQVNQQLATAQQNLGEAQAAVTKARSDLGRQALEAYIHGGYLSPPKGAPLSGKLDLVVQKDYFGLATNNEADSLDRLRTTENRLTQERIALQGSQQDARVAVATLADRQKAIVQADSADKATLTKVNGELAQLVAQQQAQLEAQRVAQEQAALAAQLAKQQQLAAAQASAAKTQAVVASSGSGLLPAARPPVGPAPPPVPPGSSRGLVALAFARAQLGKPYLWGGAGPNSFDCSGLTMRAWQAAGVSLPHFAAAQYGMIAHVPISALQPGDLVFFGSDLHHVGIYAGGGQMIDAPYTGTVVRYDSIFWGDLFGAGRPG